MKVRSEVRVLKWWSAGLLAANLALSTAPAGAATREVLVSKLQPLVRQGTLSAMATIRDRGTTGLRTDLERCYRKVAAKQDQTAAVFCITQDRYGTVSITSLFPGAGDPFFNWQAFARRVARALNSSVLPASGLEAFATALGAMQEAELKIILDQINAASQQDSQP